MRTRCFPRRLDARLWKPKKSPIIAKKSKIDARRIDGFLTLGGGRFA
jgi:hypothetical protein